MKSRHVILAAVAVALSGCNGITPVTPEVPSCQTNNTAKVSFANRSLTNSTYTIVWDGATKDTLAPNETSTPFDVAAGVAHTLRFRFANTTTLACNDSSPVLAQCSTMTYNCTG